MARYSKFKYAGAKYGATVDDLYLWTFMVAWNGTYTGDNEANNAIAMQVKRGRDHLVGNTGRGFEHYQPGIATITLDNEDGRYDPWNTSSPLYPNVSPGKFCRILVKDNATGTNYGIMRGIIEDIQPIYYQGMPCARITVKDGLNLLNNAVVKVGLNASTVRESNLLDILNNIPSLNMTEWPWVASVSTDTQTYFWAWQISALEAINKVVDAEGGVFFHDREGNLKFRTRGYTQQRTMVADETVILRDVALNQPWELVKNQIKVVAHTKYYDEKGGSPATVWQLQDIPAIADGESYIVEAVYTYDRFNPVASADNVFSFSVNTLPTGAGVDLSAGCTLTYPTEQVSGEGVTLTLTNNSGSDGYITLLRVQGDPIEDPHPSTRMREDAISETTYGVKTLTIDSQWLEDTTLADTRAAWLLYYLKNPQLAPVIQFENRPDYQYYLDLYDRLSLNIASKGINLDFRVGSIEHQWLRANGQSVRTIIHLEPYMVYFVPSSLWIFPAIFGTNTTLA